MINEFCWYLEHKSRRLLHFIHQKGIIRFFLLFKQYGVKILINSSWDTQYIHVLSSSRKALQIQPLKQTSLMRNYDPLSQIFIPKGYPFHWPTTKYTPFAHTCHTPPLKIDPKHCFPPPFFFFFAHLPDFATLIVVRMSVPSVWKPYPFPHFFCSWITTWLARVPPWVSMLMVTKKVYIKENQISPFKF